MEDTNNIHKIWGERRRLLLTSKTEIDLVTLKKDTFCSTHYHDKKTNRFIVVSGKVRIESEYGSTILEANDSFEVCPPLRHRFFALEDSVMVECAYTDETVINPDDIVRISQGGKVIDGKEITLVEMREQGLLDLYDKGEKE